MIGALWSGYWSQNYTVKCSHIIIIYNVWPGGGELKPLLSLGSAKDWPRRALLLPGEVIT